jgi:nucleoside-diphosphate-sugar epimerase
MEHPDALNEDFNLSTNESTTVLELARAIWLAIKGPDVPFSYVSDPPFSHDVKRRIPSTDKAKRILGFEATTGLEKILEDVVPWIEKAVADGTI